MSCNGCSVFPRAAAISCAKCSCTCSWCMCSIGDVCAQPVIIRSALFCIVCSVLWCVSDKLGAHNRSDELFVNCGCCFFVLSEVCPC